MLKINFGIDSVRQKPESAAPLQMADDDDLLTHYEVDYTRAKPNRFAGKKQIVVGAVPADYETEQPKRTSKSGGGRRASRSS